MNWRTVLSSTMLAFLAFSVVKTAYPRRDSELRREYVAVVRAARWWMIPAAVITYGVVASLVLVLWNVPVLRFSWWQLVSGSSSNIAMGNTGFTGIGWTLVALGMPLLIAVVVPTLALAEERMFRWNSERQSLPASMRRQFLFGLVHCVFAGVPIAAGIALTVSGMYFRGVYLRSVNKSLPSTGAQNTAVYTAAAAHAVYNWLLVSVVIVTSSVLLVPGR